MVFLQLLVGLFCHVVVLLKRLAIVVIGIEILMKKIGWVMPVELKLLKWAILFIVAVIDMLDHRFMQRVVTFVLGILAFLFIAKIVAIH